MNRLYLKDPGGLLTPDAVRELAPHFVAAAPPGGAELHGHCTTGLAPFRLRRGRAGRVRDRPHGLRPALARHLAARAHEHRRQPRERRLLARGRPRGRGDRRRALPPALAAAKGLPAGAPQEFDAGYLPPPAPGGDGHDGRSACSARSAVRSSSTRCSRRSCGCAPRWATRSSSRRFRSSSRPRPRAT